MNLSCDDDGDDGREPRVPVLILPRSKADRSAGLVRCYSLSANEVSHMCVPREPRWISCLNSCGNWLIVFDAGDSNLHMVNPQQSIPLPPLTTFPDVWPGKSGFRLAPGEPFTDYHFERPHMPFRCNKSTTGKFYFRKAVLGWNGDSSAYTAMVIRKGFVGEVAFARQGDTCWTRIPPNSVYQVEDIMCYNGRFLALSSEGTLSIIALHLDKPKVYQDVTEAVPDDPEDDLATLDRDLLLQLLPVKSTRYLVEFDGKLHQVLRVQVICKEDFYTTRRFKVYELVVKKHKRRQLGRWVEVTDLQGHSIFAGYNDAVAVPARGSPALVPNCIYFTDTDNELPTWQGKKKFLDEGIYSLETGLFDALSPDMRLLSGPRLVWFMPDRSSQGAAKDHRKAEMEGEKHNELKGLKGKEIRMMEWTGSKRKRDEEGGKEWGPGEEKHRRKMDAKDHILAGQ